MSSLLQDLRYAARTLRKSPGFVTVAIVSLALGIGANTAIFSFFDAALLRALPVERPEELVELAAVYPNSRQTNVPGDVYEPVAKATDCFAALTASYPGSISLRADGRTDHVRALYILGNYLRTLGVGASLGRNLFEEDDQPDAPRVVMLSHDLWSRLFGRRSDVLGRKVLVDGFPATVIGVTSSGFFGLDRSFHPEVFLPMSVEHRTQNLWISGRLRPGVTLAQARARIASLYSQGIASATDRLKNWPALDRSRFLSQRVDLMSIRRGGAGLRWRLAEPLRVLGAVVTLILLIACANVGALMLARRESRSSESAVRFALGASRLHVVRGLLVESTLLSVLGGATGVAVAFALHSLLVALLPVAPFADIKFRLDGHVLAFTLVLSVSAGILTGVAPAFNATRVRLFAILKGTVNRSRRWRGAPTRAILVVQVAGVLVLLVGAGSFLRSLWKLNDVDVGLDRARVVIARINPTLGSGRGARVDLVQDRLVERMRELPDVEAAAVAINDVFGRGPYIFNVWVDGYVYAAGERQFVAYNEVGPGFFSTVGVPLVAGRDFDTRDVPSSPKVVIVNLAFARKYFGSQNPLGRRIGHSGAQSSRDYEIVGLVGDTKMGSLREVADPMVFLALPQGERMGSFSLHVRAARAAASIPLIRREMTRGAPDLDVIRIATLDDQVAGTLRRERLFAILTSLFAGIALTLAGVGVFGTLASAVARRRSEIGIRMALGADRRRIVRMTLREGLLVLALGTAFGLPGAFAATRSLRALLFGLGSFDPITLAGAVVTLTAMAVLASVIPAKRAARVDPMEALRCE